MRRPPLALRLAAALPALALVAAAACVSATEADATFDHDLDAARARWEAARPRDYAFELRTETVWVPSRGFQRIEVRNGVAVTPPRAVTIDSLYARFAAAGAFGDELTRLRFSAAGVPLEAMTGTFANDGGVHYEVRSFTRLR